MQSVARAYIADIIYYYIITYNVYIIHLYNYAYVEGRNNNYCHRLRRPLADDLLFSAFVRTVYTFR